MHSDSGRRLQTLSPSSLLLPTTMSSLEEQATLLTQQINVLQNHLSAQTPSPSADPPPPPTMTKLLKITAPTLLTGLQDDLDHFKVECSLYIHLQGSKFPNETSQMLFILSYMKGRATRTWVMHKIQQVLSPSEMPMTMDEFEAEVNLVFADPN